MESNEEFSPQKSLQLIESMINKARNRFSEDGSMYLLWGWFVFFCSLSQFILLHIYNYPKHYMVWMASWLLLAFQFIYMRRKKRKEKVRTYTDYIITYVWITFVVTIFLIGFFIGRLTQGDYYTHINHLILAVYGMPIFLSGIILRFRPLVLGGIGCWVLSIASTFITEYDYQLLMIPAAMLIAWIIPGYLLRAKYKSQT
jgi:hypothetical protein